MAVIRPFRAILPTHQPGADVSDRVAPPYDVVGPAYRRELLARDRRNIIALELPEGSPDPSAPGNRYETGGARWREWLDDGSLVLDESETVYVLEQRFEHTGRKMRRRCLIASVDLEPFSAGVIIPHERTLPKVLDDRLNLIRATAANLSQVLAMFSDPDGVIDGYFDRATDTEPLFSAVDDDGVESTVWTLRDPDAIEGLVAFFTDEPLFIADGHHRYTTALTYRDECHGTSDIEVWRPHDGVMMALFSMDDPDLVVLPTHRVADAPGDFDPATFRSALTEHFELTDCGPDPVATLEAQDRPSFVIRTPGDEKVVLARLKSDVSLDEVIGSGHSSEWKSLDVTVLLELVLSPLLDIDPDRPETLDRLSFVKDSGEALAVDGHDVVALVRPTRMDQLRAVALNGETMPQKSTYFYPKVLSGLLMRSLDDWLRMSYPSSAAATRGPFLRKNSQWRHSSLMATRRSTVGSKRRAASLVTTFVDLSQRAKAHLVGHRS